MVLFLNKAHISIHAPRVGSDPPFKDCHRSTVQFQSTLPVWGATPVPCSLFLQGMDFNPRSPCGERHCLLSLFMTSNRISIHAPRVGSDSFCPSFFYSFNLFQSTLPVWGATTQHSGTDHWHKISIHAPRVGSDTSSL